MTNSIIKYAVNEVTGRTAYIKDVLNGLSCNCICLKCGEKMIAVQGKSFGHREWHFRHFFESNCKGGQETAIHKLAKQIILENSTIVIPGETLNYSNARLEERLNAIIPDVSVCAEGSTIYFEIIVTNPINVHKESFYKLGQHKSIEIDLRDIRLDIVRDELETLILNEVSNKRKVFWSPELLTSGSLEQDRNWWADIIGALIVILGLIWLVGRRHKWLGNKN